MKIHGQLCGLDVCGGGVNIRGRDASWGLRIALRRDLTYDFTHIVYGMSSKLLRGMDLMTVKVDRTRVWMCSPCVYNLRCENEGATTRCGHLL